jgi:hypothetical protein
MTFIGGTSYPREVGNLISAAITVKGGIGCTSFSSALSAGVSNLGGKLGILLMPALSG